MERIDYPVGFRFYVSIEGTSDIDTSFSEVSGISAQISTEEVTEGGENRFKHRLPLHVSYTPLVLKRGLALKDSLFVEWVNKTIQNNFSEEIEPKNITVMLLNESADPIVSWTFEKAYPLKFEVSGLKSDSSQLVIENIELSYQSYKETYEINTIDSMQVKLMNAAEAKAKNEARVRAKMSK